MMSQKPKKNANNNNNNIKKKDGIISAITNATNDTQIKTPHTVYEYEVENSVKPEISIYRKSLVLRPWFIFLSINICALLALLFIGYGLSIGISSASSRIHGESCNTTSECSQTDYLICANNKCECPNTKYFNGATCANRLSINSNCMGVYENECGYGLNCYFNTATLSSSCLCSKERFWDTRISYCQLLYSFNQTGCSASEQCQTGANMVCLNSKCTCENKKFWNGSMCGNVANYMDTCSIDVNCDTTKLLNCSITGESLYKCVCAFDYYWSSSSNICLAKKTNTDPCSSSSECRDDLGLVCSSGACSCLNTYYWSVNKCLRKIQYNQICTAHSQCDDTIGLTMCSAGRCVCPSLYFYNGTSCQFLLENGYNCNSTFTCDTNKFLTCDAALKKCICLGTRFWNYTTCVDQRISGESCVHTIQCKSSVGLYCDATNTKQCMCLYTHYWDGTACQLKLSNTIGCSVGQCQDYKGLTCSGTCQCPTDYYWNTTLCLSQVLFNEACTGPYAASMCMTSKGLSCSSGVCRCTNSGNYWDSTNCVPKLGYGISCQFQVTTMTNSQCDERPNLYLVCLATPYTTNTYTCRCPSTMRWTGSACVTKSTYKGSCVNGVDTDCQDYNGLICNTFNNTCLCPVTKYWDFTDLICKDKLPINSACTYPATTEREMCQDYAWLYCNSNFPGVGTCQCPSDRYYSTSFMACLPRASHDQYCGDGTLCMPSTPRVLTCKPEAGDTCQCENYQVINSPYYWSATESNCRACPNGYFSGYGYNIQSSDNSITSRCYKVVNDITLDWDLASANCIADGGNLINIRNTMEMGVAAFWSSGTRSFWIGAKSSGGSFTLQNYGLNVVPPLLWCKSEPNCNCVAGAFLHGDRGDCLDEAVLTSSLNFICEKF